MRGGETQMAAKFVPPDVQSCLSVKSILGGAGPQKVGMEAIFTFLQENCKVQREGVRSMFSGVRWTRPRTLHFSCTFSLLLRVLVGGML